MALVYILCRNNLNLPLTRAQNNHCQRYPVDRARESKVPKVRLARTASETHVNEVRSVTRGGLGLMHNAGVSERLTCQPAESLARVSLPPSGFGAIFE